MYPNQPQQFQPQPTPPPDYLNQIAPQAPKQSPLKLNLKSVLILGGALVALVVAIAIIVGIVSNSQRQPLQQLTARLASIQVIANKAQSNLKSSQLRSTNSNLTTFLTNTNREIGPTMLAAGIKTDKIPESVLTRESSDNVLKSLENARLNAVFDRTYVREMTFILSNTVALMQQIQSSNSNAELRDFLDNALPSLIAIQKSFAEFNGNN